MADHVMQQREERTVEINQNSNKKKKSILKMGTV